MADNYLERKFEEIGDGEAEEIRLQVRAIWPDADKLHPYVQTLAKQRGEKR